MEFGYRTEQLFGEGYRNAAEVMAHEVFQLQNTDILDTLSSTILKGTDMGNSMRQISKVMDDDASDEKIEDFLDKAFEDNNIAIDYFKLVLNELEGALNKSIKYVIWLCDSVEDVINEYSSEEIGDNFTEFDVYNKSNVILADLGSGGKLYGYRREPNPVMTVNRRNEKI